MALGILFLSNPGGKTSLVRRRRRSSDRTGKTTRRMPIRHRRSTRARRGRVILREAQRARRGVAWKETVRKYGILRARDLIRGHAKRRRSRHMAVMANPRRRRKARARRRSRRNPLAGFASNPRHRRRRRRSRARRNPYTQMSFGPNPRRRSRRRSHRRARRNPYTPMSFGPNPRRRRRRSRKNSWFKQPRRHRKAAKKGWRRRSRRYARNPRRYMRNPGAGVAAIPGGALAGLKKIANLGYWMDEIIPVAVGGVASKVAASQIMPMIGLSYSGIQRHVGNVVASALTSAVTYFVTKSGKTSSQVLAGGLTAALIDVIYAAFGGQAFIAATAPTMGDLSFFGASDLERELEERILREVEGGVSGVNDFVSREALQGMDAFVTAEEIM